MCSSPGTDVLNWNSLAGDAAGVAAPAPTQTVEEKTMKRVLLALLAVTMVFGSVFVAGCSKSADAPAAPANAPSETPAPGAGG